MTDGRKQSATSYIRPEFMSKAAESRVGAGDRNQQAEDRQKMTKAMSELKKLISQNENDFTNTKIDTRLRQQQQTMISAILPYPP